MSSELFEFEKKMVAGFEKASQRLVETSAAKNESLVISINGEVRHVPAKELLAKMNAPK